MKMHILFARILVHALVFSVILPILPACNARACFSLGSTAGYGDCPEELELASSVALYIACLAALRGWENVQNYYGAETTSLRIAGCASGYGDDYAISFYSGHGFAMEYYGGYHSYITDKFGNRVWDWYLHQFTFERNTRFAFIWSCYQGYEIGGYYDGMGVYAPHGMPLALLPPPHLDLKGYAGTPYGDQSCAFIGWDGVAPWLSIEDPTGSGADEAGYNFLLNFYASALYHQNSLNDALDNATYAVWGPSFRTFADCPYYNTWFQRY